MVAIAAVWLLWGSTFAGMRAAVQTMPPFAMAAARFLIAGALLFALAALRGKARVTRADLVRALVTGATLLLLGNGMTAWTVQYLPSGINSLLLSCSPIWMAIVAYLWGGEKPSRLAVVGMVLGLAGLALLVGPQSRNAIAFWPAIVAVLASISWSFGSIFQRRIGGTDSVVLATALQMLVGGTLLAIEAALTGEWGAVHVRAISATSWVGFAWLVVFGSIAGYSAYLYTMRAASTMLASTYAYVNPIVSLALGYALFGETLNAREGLASAVIVAGVALMMMPAGRERAQAG
ncbi:MAG TPA: EamA family transporter [Candidatus Acidoferrum sp.]|nr:EamA family transporter [Candidatus Acidoferrum sp.]